MSPPIPAAYPIHQRIIIATLMTIILRKVKEVVGTLQRDVTVAGGLLPEEVHAV